MKTYAQNYEDVRLWKALGHVRLGRYVDIGAQDPVHDSVSRLFYERGWRGVHVDPMPQYAAALREARPDEIVIEAAVSASPGPLKFYAISESGLSTGLPNIASEHVKAGWGVDEITVDTMSLSSIFDQIGEGPIHWLKIDVEGMERDVLASWGVHPQRPWILIIESTFPMSQRDTHGEWIDLAVKRGYRDVCFDGLSRFLVHEDHMDLADKLEKRLNLFDGFQVQQRHFSTIELEANYSAREAAIGAEVAAQAKALEAELDNARLQTEVALSQLAAERECVKETQERLNDQLSRQKEEFAVERDRMFNILGEQQAAAATQMSQAVQQFEQTVAAVLHDKAQAILEMESKASSLKKELDEALGDARAAMAEAAGARRKIELLEIENHDLGAAVSVANERLALELVESTRLLENLEKQSVSLQMVEADLSAAKVLASNLKESRGRRDERLENVKSIVQKPSLKLLSLFLPSIQTLRRLTLKGFADGDIDAFVGSIADEQEHRHNLTASEKALIMYPTADPYHRADSLEQLCRYCDLDFVRCAYVTILGRQPDPTGEQYYVERLRAGISKCQILWQLRRSKEGKAHDPGIAGLDRTLRQARGQGLWKLAFWLHESDGPMAKRLRQMSNDLGMCLKAQLVTEKRFNALDEMKSNFDHLSAADSSLSNEEPPKTPLDPELPPSVIQDLSNTDELTVRERRIANLIKSRLAEV